MRIAVSACLLGEACRYDGRAKVDEAVTALAGSHELVPVCPEVLGGLPTPRARCEIVAGDEAVRGAGAEAIHKAGDGVVRVMDEAGEDRTDAFAKGARKAVEAARKAGCELAILKSKSPSCGVGLVYDGTFTGTLVPGDGLAARAFREAGIRVVNETQLHGSLPYELHG